MSTLNSKFDILRGWPNSSAVAEDWVVPTISNGHDNLKTGHWVRLDPAVPTVMTCKSETRAAKDMSRLSITRAATAVEGVKALTAYGLPYTPLWALVIEGQDEYSSAFSKRVTVLLGGGYVVRLWNVVAEDHADAADDNMFVSANMAPGVPVTLVDGQIAYAGAINAAMADLTGDDPDVASRLPIGWCVRYDSANATCDIFVK